MLNTRRSLDCWITGSIPASAAESLLAMVCVAVNDSRDGSYADTLDMILRTFDSDPLPDVFQEPADVDLYVAGLILENAAYVYPSECGFCHKDFAPEDVRTEPWADTTSCEDCYLLSELQLHRPERENEPEWDSWDSLPIIADDRTQLKRELLAVYDQIRRTWQLGWSINARLHAGAGQERTQ